MDILADAPGLAAFLSATPVAVMSVVVDAAGTLHIAPMNYWHDPKTLDFYFVTKKSSEKCTLLRDGSAQKAACVVGTENGVLFTLQMRGVARIVPKNEYKFAIDAYTKKRGDDHGITTAEYILLQFHPTWARYTDYGDNWKQHLLDLG